MLNGICGRAANVVGFINNNFRVTRREKWKSFWSWSKEKKNDADKPKIIKPQRMDCTKDNRQILNPECKVAIVLGGSADMGLSAADSLLYHGARVVVLADEDPRSGEVAAQSLCDFYGKNRARFLRCDQRSLCQLEAVCEETICRYKRIDVLFSNLDRNHSETRQRAGSCDVTDETQLSNTARAINTGLKYLGLRDKKKEPGIIVNGSSIIGFMGWPEDPVPIYCFNKEPVAETTMDLAKMYPVEKTGVRIVAILKSHRPFNEIALPDFPTSNSKSHRNASLSKQCEPSAESRIGKALTHVMARAPTGTVWLSEPAPCPREIPWQIHFPAHQGESADHRNYEKQMLNYSNPMEPVVAQPVNSEQQMKCLKIGNTRE